MSIWIKGLWWDRWLKEANKDDKNQSYFASS
jgi:hypothetical protein